jgi:hypothetical protein
LKLWSDADGNPVADLIVGNSANYRALRVRRAGDDEVYEVGGLSAYDLRAAAAAWVSTKLVDFSTDAVERLAIKNPTGTLELVKGESGWTVEGNPAVELDTAKVETLVRTVTGLSIAEPLGPSDTHGPSAADAKATVTLSGPVGTMVILIGDKRSDDEARRSITVEGSGFSGTIWDSSVRSLLEKTLTDLRAG